MRGSSFSEARKAESEVPGAAVRGSPLTVNARVDGSCTSGVVIRRKIVVRCSFGIRRVPDSPDHGKPVRARRAEYAAVVGTYATNGDHGDLDRGRERTQEREAATLLTRMRRRGEHVTRHEPRRPFARGDAGFL